jgi:hypothetical protein
MSWIKMRKDLVHDPSVVLLSGRLGLDPRLVVGVLHQLWSWADTHTETGIVRCPTGWLDGFVGIPGWSVAMRDAGWLQIEAGRKSMVTLTFPRFERHNGATAKKRATDARRAAAYRQKGVTNVASERDERHGGSVTNVRNDRDLEKRREEKKTPPYPPQGGRGEIAVAEGGGEGGIAELDRAWERWQRHRLELGKPLTPKTKAAQLRKLSAVGFVRAVLIIDHSIAQGYVGLYDPGGGVDKSTGDRESDLRADRVVEQTRQKLAAQVPDDPAPVTAEDLPRARRAKA